jgi:hypothetical protein
LRYFFCVNQVAAAVSTPITAFGRGQEVMAIDLVIFTDIGKAGKRLFFIRGANLLKLFFKPLSDELSGRIGVCALDRNEVRAFWKKR